MIFVRRDAGGQIVSVSLESDASHVEVASRSDPAVAVFMRALADDDSLEDSDLRLVRVLEDVIDLLIERDLIRFTDLPYAAQQKLMKRRSLRESKGSLDLLSGGNEVL